MRSRSSSMDQQPHVRSRSSSMEQVNPSPSGTLSYPKRSPRVGVLATRSRSNSMEGQTRSRSNSSSNESPGQAVKQLSIYQVLASPCLKEALKWYAVSVFAFENIFFVDKVDCGWKFLFAEGMRRDDRVIELTARELVKTFIGQDAPWQISLPSQQQRKLAESVALAKPGEMKADLFDSAYNTVVRDLGRSLTQFQATPLFESYMAHRDDLDALFSTNKRGGTVSEVLARIRHVYKTHHPVRLDPLSAPSERATHKCTADDEVVGYARQDTFTLRFFDLGDQELLVLPANAIEAVPSTPGRGRSVTAPHIEVGGGSPKKAEESKEAKEAKGRKASVAVTEKKRFSFGFGKSRAASAAEKIPSAATAPAAPAAAAAAVVLPSEGLLKDLSSGTVHGPFRLADLRLWWKFHLLSPSTPVCWETGAGQRQAWRLLGDCADFGFAEAQRVQMVDPTRVSSFE